MKHFAILIVLFFSFHCQAQEWSNTLIGLCDTKSDTFTIAFLGNGNDVSLNSDNNQSFTTNTCKLSDGTYELKPRHFFRSTDGLGRCGAHEYVEIKILRDGEGFYQSLVQGDCHYSDTYISSVTILPSNKDKVVVETKPVP
ncbi:hypothetical protein OAP14_07645 [Aliiglaciecola sp.]|nr:hypothetical protein [Aliiglaciecola sp.]